MGQYLNEIKNNMSKDTMIKINLKLFVTLNKYLPEDLKEKTKNNCIEISTTSTVDDLIEKLGIPKELIKLIFINGKKQDGRYQLKNNDRVGFFPPVGGG